MANLIIAFLLFTIVCVGDLYAQENTQTSVSKSLEECYNNTEILEKDNKLPMTLSTLLDLIRKVENGPDRIDLTALTVSLIQRFRQDGIVRAVGIRPESLGDEVLPYSPNGFTNDKFRMVLKYMVPGNALRFPNDTLTTKEKCTLHTMMSSTIEDWERNDEAVVCNKISKYRKRMRKRSVKYIPDDVEVIDEKLLETKGDIKVMNPDVERIGNLNVPKSECPVENGVIYTPWGTVAVGPLLAGIAAGAQPDMHIKLTDIARDVINDLEIDNLWGATLAGDLAEAALFKNEEDDETSNHIEVGASGGWNSTDDPHWYFLQKKTQLYFTDAEIRGGLDGMILGKLYREQLSNKGSSLKLSQFIDMYYTRGVFNEKYKACNRRELFKEVAPLEEMKVQGKAFAIALDKRVRLRVSLKEVSIITQVNEAATSLEEYIPSKLNDPSCVTYTTGDSPSAYTDIILAIDTQYPYKEMKNIVTYILRNLDLNQYTGNYTIINANDGSIMVNSTNTKLDLYSAINETTYNKAPKGNVDMVKIIRQTEELARQLMQNEKNTGGGGRSLIALYIFYTDPQISDYVIKRVKDYINVFTPDLKFFVVTKGKKDLYGNIVKDTTRDVIMYTSMSSTSEMTQLTPLIDRLKEVPRRFVNPKCGSDWTESGSSNQQLTQFISPQSINFYRVHPNYFFGDGSRSIKIKTIGTGQLTVCYSRSNIQPRANQTGGDAGDVTCKTITTEEYVISLTDACKDKYLIHDCVPVYFSVQSSQASETISYSCTDNGCRFPDDMKYTVTGENLICQSGANTLRTNIFILISILSTVFLKMYA